MTTTVDCLFVNPFGEPIADTAVTFQPMTAGYDASLEGIVMPQEVEAVTDENGECTVELWPSPIPYIVRCDDTEQEVGISYRIIVPETGVTQRLQDLISVSPAEDWWDGTTLALILAYRDAAIAAAAAAAADAVDATSAEAAAAAFAASSDAAAASAAAAVAVVTTFSNSLNRVSKYGTVVGDGTTDDSAAFIAAAASGAKYIDARGLTCRISSAFKPATGQTWFMDGAVLNATGTSFIIVDLDVVADVNLIGAFTLKGDGTTIGTSKGIRIKDSSNIYIDRPICKTIKGWGIFIEPGSSTSLRSQHGTINNLRIDQCYYGWEDVAGTGAEYWSVVNPYVTRCTFTGVITSAGNMNFIGGQIVDNLAIGVNVKAGANHAHGTFNGTHINHNGTFNIQTDSVLTGQMFNACHIYEGSVWFNLSKGIHIFGGVLDCPLYNYKDGTSGLNMIDGCYCPGDYGVKRNIGSNDGHDELIIRNLWGPGALAASGGKDTAGVALNDPAICAIVAQLDAAATQSLTSGVAATLLFPTAIIPDRRLIYSAGTFTVPANQGGLWRAEFDCLFGGTAMSAIGTFIEVKVNGTLKKLCLAGAGYSTTKLQVSAAFPLYLNPGDAVTFVGTCTGTTPVFGDGAVASNVTLTRIA